VISAKALIDMFVDIVAKGGNLLLIVNLDGQGALPKIQENRLHDIGRWLKVNGEGIYATRSYKQPAKDSVSYTQSKDGQYIYAIIKEWPGSELHLKDINPVIGSKIKMLGNDLSFKWKNTKDGISIKVPAKLQDIRNRPCVYVWILKIRLTNI
jgi:alpha-L-fucosidase